ncbi:DUF1508 domain-containing protein [Amycolatopsis pigmentata]|uniref:DUF1508 domain-containing protein n=1 Tax=Amycolatopsis pigmentata TaxID=450801 RepID=A0ABW5FQF4_9PSEU
MHSDDDRSKRAVRMPRFQLIVTDTDLVRWRLLGSNNVCLGMGADGYPGAGHCVAAIRHLCEHVEAARAEFRHDNGIDWRWLLHDGATPIAKSGHAYGRRIEAVRGHGRFLAAVGEAARGKDVEITRAKHRIGQRGLFVGH